MEQEQLKAAGNGSVPGIDGGMPSEVKPGGEEDAQEAGLLGEEEEGGPRPILPYSSLFCLSSTNP